MGLSRWHTCGPMTVWGFASHDFECARGICGLWKMYKVSVIPHCTRKIMWLLINNIRTKIGNAVLFWHLESEPVLKAWTPDKNCGPNGLKLLVLLMFVSVADFLGITSFHLWKHHWLRGTADFVHSRYFVIVFKGLQVSVACHVYNLASLEVCSLQLFNCLSGAWLENTFNKFQET